MLLSFGLLSLNSFIFGEDATNKYILKYIEIPFGFGLRWMNIYFTPPFITLILADKVSVKECFIIAAVFIFGYLIGFAFIGYFVWGLQILMGTYPYEECGLTRPKLSFSIFKKTRSQSSDDERAVDLEKGQQQEEEENHGNEHDDLPTVNSSISYNAEDVVLYGDDIDEGLALQEIATNHELSRAITRCSTNQIREEVNINDDKDNNMIDDEQSISTISNENNELKTMQLERCDKFANHIIEWFDFYIYGLLFIIGLPIYFTTSYELPIQLSTAVFLFRVCSLTPPKWRRFLHPILISFALSLLVFYILSLIHNQNFYEMIRHYKTGRTYLYLFDKSKYSILPGAGDFFSSMMDISIASLSLAMYKYRLDLKKYFSSLMPPIILSTFMSFFIYPPLCYHLSISPARSLGFTGRSVTMALGTPLVDALGGSTQLMAVTTIMSGILGVLVGDFLIFNLMRVRKGDFVTRGVTLGVNCGAVSTAHLLNVDSRAAAMSSLSFSLFGTFMVILAAIRPLVHVIQGLVGW
ncbi:hypothetical protein CANARDRAFT_26668 [[Candida] arabinofermentans NRRL YB-2248]|uniref:LrgB-like protein n=1 Tax=[Candida] arabinofermentans NRRL YB-2248 TaxID=983967 RepID=A0A1E4T664_9ASCO|nr:hypothetical protein CANARDRAFT_26668 [[Candida] arabinofermentans NRRL YB-2248]